MGESRIELLAWLNDLLQLNYTKIEQCGTGAAACGIIDSIYYDVPLAKVKFSAKHEYEYVNNFKVLQEAFRRHKIDKNIPVERLVKCKMMENLEFLQWLKRYWDMHFAGTEYDAASRRRGAVTETNPPIAGVVSAHNPQLRAGIGGTVAAPRVKSSNSHHATNPKSLGAATVTSVGMPRTGGPSGTAALDRVTAELNDMKFNVEGLEKERNFYFVRSDISLVMMRHNIAQEKLRNIEIVVGARLEAEPAPAEHEEAVLKEIQAVLYQTEPGFEIPDVEDEASLVDEEETF